MDQKPDWSALMECGINTLHPGETVENHFHDCGEYLFVISGDARICVGDHELNVTGGEVVLIETSTLHSIPEVRQPTTILYIKDKAQPPFRTEHTHEEKGHRRAPRIAPKYPLTSPEAVGHALTLEAGNTFVPALLSRRPGDLLIRLAGCKPLNDLQAREVRKCCVANRQAIAVLSLPVDAETLETKAFDKHLWGNIRQLRPHVVSVMLDPMDRTFPDRLESLREYWLPLAHVDHFELAVQFAFGVWTPDELLRHFQWLWQLPPSQWGIVLEWNQKAFESSAEAGRLLLKSMVPWLKAVVCKPEDATTVSEFLNPLGWQGWTIVE